MTWKAGDVIPEWGDRPLSAGEAAALNEREAGPREPRRLTRQERIEARHWLQALSEQARGVRNAMDPVNGLLNITDEAWAGQWAELRRNLDAFTARVMASKPAPRLQYTRQDWGDICVDPATTVQEDQP